MGTIELKSDSLDSLHELKEWLQGVLEGTDVEEEIPDSMPDGTPITTLEDLAAVTQKTILGAAFLVLNTKEAADPALVDEAVDVVQTLQKPPDSDQGGLCLMIAIPEEVSAGWKGVAVDKNDLHITILYFGDVNEYDMNAETFYSYARQIARRHQPFEVALNGLSRFSMDPLDAVVVNADAPELEELRADSLISAQMLNVEPELNHGYTPHMTLGYLDHDASLPSQRWEPQVFEATHLIAAYGDEKVHIMLGSGNDVKSVMVRCSKCGKTYAIDNMAERRKHKAEHKDVFRGQGLGGIPDTANFSRRVRRSHRRARVISNRPHRRRIRFPRHKED